MDKNTKTPNLNSGFTLVEIIVVIGILAIIASMGLYFSIDNYKGSSYRDELDLLVSSIEHSRAEAINNICYGTSCTDGESHGVHFYPKSDPNHDRFVIFQGTSFIDGDELNDVIKFDNKTVYVDVSFPVDIIFDRLSGSLISGSITSMTLKDDMGHSTAIEINSEGRIDWHMN